MPSSTASKRLVVFDFDWTLIEADTDIWVIQGQGGEVARQQEALYGTMQWTDLQDQLLGQLYDQGITRQDLETSLRGIPFAPEMAAALRLIKSQGAELCIISDSNSFYIDTVLKNHGLDQLFSKIITNPCHFDTDGRPHVTRLHGLDQPPHHCTMPCNVNLCKGRELQKLMDSQTWDQVIYMGDSTNDFCPSTRLAAHTDVVLARANMLLEKEIKSHPGAIKAKVVYWNSPADAIAVIHTLFGVPCRDIPSTIHRA
ncbi:hypothetical protein BGZ99_007044 [Dissophora globulifera]|uniref:Uncharacterized protein n=1 Tax=Dissophora globulifera TaxID=979702 RepID=A0A9P6UQ93_9FUNG|nr:hypothetical protein BGZ99_007044 [Dissophora globulifera]